MMQFGIRNEADLHGEWGGFVADSVSTANSFLAESGKRFYFDTVDVAQQIIGGLKLCDMFGWVVRSDEASAFEALWREGADHELDEYEYVCLTWTEVGGRPVASFD